MREAYLKGKVVKGMFKGERGVIITFGDRTLALFADESDITELMGPGPEQFGKLRVFVRELGGGKVRVYLTQDPIAGPRTLILNASEVES